MNKFILMLAGVISLIISVIINFNAGSVGGLLIGSLILGSILSGIVALIIKSIQNKQKSGILFGVLALLVLLLFFMALFGGNICTFWSAPADFRTNILTGKCEVAHLGCSDSDRWYYKNGCDIPDEEKIEVFKKIEWYDDSIERCNLKCQMGNSEEYCSNRTSEFLSVRGLSCNDLVSCDEISCD